MTIPKAVEIFDDTMREGLQIESPDISIDDKLRLLDAIGEMGAKTISIGSFAHPKWTPSMAKIDELAKRFTPKPGVKYTALVFNEVGYERADAYYPKIDVRQQSLSTHVELCDTFARRNYNRTQREQIDIASTIVNNAAKADREYGSIVLGSPFGSNFEGRFTLEQRMELLTLLIEKWHEKGLEVLELSLLDGMGWNMPHVVEDTILAIRDRYPEIRTFHLHFHNTRGAGLASYYEALRHGVTRFDTSLGGLGGCPYCGNGRAAGHVPTEDFVQMCHEMEIETGYDLDKVIDAAIIAEEVVGHQTNGHVSKAGPLPEGDALYPPNMPFIESLEEASHFRNGASVYKNQRSPWSQSDELVGTSDD